MSLKIRNAKGIQSKSRQNEVRHISGDNYEVVSGASGKVYQVNLAGQHGGKCTCDWGQYRPANDQRSGCSHVVAVISYAAREEGAASVSVWSSEADARRQHRQTLNIGDGVLVTVRGAA